MEISKKRTQEEEEEEEDQRYKYTTALGLAQIKENKLIITNNQKKRKVKEEDNSEETRESLLQWINTITLVAKNLPPERIVGVDAVEICSKPIRKQLTESDVKVDQNRLMLSKTQVEKKLFPLLTEKEFPHGTKGLVVKVYGPNLGGEAHEMMFKLWNKKTHVLTSGWNKFVATYRLTMHCDFLTIWMFRHKKSHEICFAIDSNRLPIRMPLSNAALKDLN